jgi:two-component system response regulator (stage 0 sporulation protein A)
MENAIRNGKVMTILKKCGTNPANLGWKYIEEAVYLVIEDPKMLNVITKGLYPAIANKFDTTESRVERAIRHTIDRICMQAPLKVLNAIMGNCRATNSAFIAALAQVVSKEPNNPIWSM